MINFLIFLFRLILGTNGTTPRYIRRASRLLFDAGLTMSTLFMGRPGSGKTMALAMEIYQLIVAHPNQAFFIFDWSGGLIIALFLLLLSDPNRQELVKRFRFDDMAGREINGEVFIMPLPEISQEYDPEKPFVEMLEDQVDRVVRTFTALNADLITRNPTMGGRPILNLLPNLLMLAHAVKDKNGKRGQLTEVTRLLNSDNRKEALNAIGGAVIKVHNYFEEVFTGKSNLDKEMGQALADVLDVIKNRRAFARVGAARPGWTPREAIEKGLVVLCDGSRLANKKLKNYEYLRLFYLILAEILKRTPSSPDYEPVNWIMDDFYTLSEIPEVSQILSHMVTELRNRKLQLFVVIQSPKQIPGSKSGLKGLEDLLWLFGNIVCFAQLDIEDAETASKHFFPFRLDAVKVAARQDGQHDIMESRDEQVAERAYKLQRLAKREAFIRRFIDEGRMDQIIHIGRTQEFRSTATFAEVERLKDELMLTWGVPLTPTLREINSRTISKKQAKKQAAEKRPKP